MMSAHRVALLFSASCLMFGCEEPPASEPPSSSQIVVLPTVSFQAPDKFDVPKNDMSSHRVKPGGKFRVEFPVKIAVGSTEPPTSIVKIRDSSTTFEEGAASKNREAEGKTIYASTEITAPAKPGMYSLQAWNGGKKITETKLVVE